MARTKQTPRLSSGSASSKSFTVHVARKPHASGNVADNSPLGEWKKTAVDLSTMKKGDAAKKHLLRLTPSAILQINKRSIFTFNAIIAKEEEEASLSGLKDTLIGIFDQPDLGHNMRIEFCASQLTFYFDDGRSAHAVHLTLTNANGQRKGISAPTLADGREVLNSIGSKLLPFKDLMQDMMLTDVKDTVGTYDHILPQKKFIM